MAVTRRGTGALANNSTGSTALGITKSDIQQGDLVVISIGWRTHSNPSPPSVSGMTWNVLDSHIVVTDSYEGVDRHQMSWWGIAPASPPSLWVVNFDATVTAVGGIEAAYDSAGGTLEYDTGSRAFGKLAAQGCAVSSGVRAVSDEFIVGFVVTEEVPPHVETGDLTATGSTQTALGPSNQQKTKGTLAWMISSDTLSKTNSYTFSWYYTWVCTIHAFRIAVPGVTLTPGVVVSATSVETPTVQTIAPTTILPGVVTSQLLVPDGWTIGVDAVTLLPGTIDFGSDVPDPAIPVIISAPVLSSPIDIPIPTVSAETSVEITPDVVDVGTEVLVPSVSSIVQLNPEVIDVTTEIQIPSVIAVVQLTPDAVDVNTETLTPSVAGVLTVTPAVIDVVVQTRDPNLVAEGVVSLIPEALDINTNLPLSTISGGISGDVSCHLVKYGDGTLYGESGACYGRISSNLMSAQEASVRQTGLKVSIIDENVNQWEYFAGADVVSPRTHKDPTIQTYYSYQGQADICVLDNGTIVRVRTNPSNHNVEVQEITDPTNTSQWTSWATYNSDDNYGVAVAPDGAGYTIYHIKAAGLYRNNSLVFAKTNLVRVNCHKGVDNQQQKDALWITEVRDGIEINGVTVRKFDTYVTEDIMSIVPDAVNWNYVWQRSSVASITRDDGQLIRITTFPQYSPIEAMNAGESIVVRICPDWTSMDDATRPRLIRGLPGEVGHSGVSGVELFRLGDFYYMFYTETHVGEDWEDTSNLRSALIWQRSKDGVNWGEPVHAGFSGWGFAGLVETDDWIYAAFSGKVYRRPASPVVYDISNYVPSVEWDMPRDNQTGTGVVTVANPEGINDYINETLQGKRIIIEPGIKTPGESGYEFAQLEDLWISRVEDERSGKISRLNIHVGNVWHRLENPLRDVYNFIGRTFHDDFEPGRPNELFQYFFDGGEPEVVNDKLVMSGGTALWTGWKGYNPFIQIRRSGALPMSIVYRWVDDENHCKATYDGDIVRIYEVVDGTETEIEARQIGLRENWGIRVVWKIVEIWADGLIHGQVLSQITQDTPGVYKPGYSGFQAEGEYTIWDLRFSDQEHNFTTHELVRQALAIADYHDAVIGSNNDRQFALIWGPQSDIPTAADALRNLLEADKAELIWRDGVITIGKFKSTTPIKTIEDRIIETTFTGEGSRRINFAQVDGNEHSWTQVDLDDVVDRDSMINSYLDLPELTSQDTVMERALEEIRRGKMGMSPGGTVPLFFDLRRMDPIRWVDNAGVSRVVRIEGMRIIINQSTQPSQRQELDTSLIDDI